MLAADELLLTGGFCLNNALRARAAHLNVLGRLTTLTFALGGDALVFRLLLLHWLKRILERLLGVLWLIQRAGPELNGFIIDNEVVTFTAMT